MSLKKAALIFALLVISIASVSAASIITTDVNGIIKTDFSPGELVYIRGTGFAPVAIIDIEIERPDLQIVSGQALSDLLGNFLYVYDLNGIKGAYRVLATDGS